jgi:ABC-type multidrug transport system fused ATPase/permease subunit
MLSAFAGPVRETLRPMRAAASGLVLLQAAQAGLLLAMPWFAGAVVSALLAQHVPGELLLAWLGALALAGLLEFASGALSARLEARAAAVLGSRLYEHLQALPLDWHRARKRGEVLARLITDTWRVAGFFAGAVVSALPLALSCLATTGILLWLEPRLGLALAFGALAFVLRVRLLTRKMRPGADALSHAEAERIAVADQNLAALSLIKAFTREPDEHARFQAHSERVRALDSRQRRRQAALAPAVRWLASALVIALLWLGASRVVSGSLDPATMVVLLLYGLYLTHPASQLAGLWGQWQHTRIALRRLDEVFEHAPEPDEGRRELPTARGDIEFERVAFAYPGRSQLFEALDLRISAGETVAITGVNGSGKSTLAHLLLRFADPKAGRILLDGVDLRELRLAVLRRQIGLVSQHVLLLNASIADNIAFGLAGASAAQVEAAARAAFAHDFICALPQGYETIVGDEGLSLSGGQRQRLSLARALLKDPRILILDEATAMFDPESEQHFVQACHELLRGRTVLLVTHRPASLAIADHVLRLRDGRIEELDAAGPCRSPCQS